MVLRPTLSESHPMPLLTSPSAISLDWECQMKYYWDKVERIKPKGPEADYYRIGGEIHTDLARLGAGDDVGTVVDSISPPVPQTQISMEEWCRRIAWVATVGEYVEPWTRERYDTVMIEGDLILDRGDLWIRCIPDRILVEKHTGRMVYREYKSAGWFSKSWTLHWPSAVQLHIGLKAIEEEFETNPVMGHVMGLLKGEIRYGRLSHPYVYAYRSPTGVWSPKYNSTWERLPTWEYGEGGARGIHQWVKDQGQELHAKVITWSEPIYADDRLLAVLVAHVRARMEVIQGMGEQAKTDRTLRNLIFESRFERCVPVIGAPCQFYDACHNHVVNQDPIGSGLFESKGPVVDVIAT
jgi:hypothetical protein